MGPPSEQKDLADAGPIGIIRESFKIYSSYFKFFFVVQFVLVSPNIIFNEVLPSLISDFQSKLHPPVVPPPLPGHVDARTGHALLNQLGHVIGYRTIVANDYVSPFWQSLGTLSVALLVNQAFQALWVAAILNAVGLVYTGNSLSFRDVFRRLPRLWKRLMVTWLWLLPILVTVAFIELALGVVVMLVLGESFNTAVATNWNKLPIGIFIAVLISSFNGVFILVAVVYEIAEGVTAMEESYGWAAYKRSRLLLKGGASKWVAITVIILWRLIPSYPLRFLATVVRAQYSRDPWNPLLWLLTVIYVVCMSLTTQLNQLCGGVMYAAFKAYHGESIADSSFFQELTKDIDDERHQRLLNGTQP